MKKIAAEYNCLWAGGLSATNIYIQGGGKEKVQEYFKEQAEIFVRHGADFLIAEVSKQVSIPTTIFLPLHKFSPLTIGLTLWLLVSFVGMGCQCGYRIHPGNMWSLLNGAHMFTGPLQ